MVRTVVVTAGALSVIVMVLWLLPHAPQGVRSPPPAPTAADEAGDAGGVLESPLRAAPRVHAPVPSSRAAGGAKTGVPSAPPAGRPAPPPASSDAVSAAQTQQAKPMPMQMLRGRENNVGAGLGEERGGESVPEATSVGVSDRTPILVPPVLRGLVVPGYPSNALHLVLDRDALVPALRVDAAQGRVVLRILVRLDGSVARAEVTESAGIPVLDDVAVQAARRWVFVPATRDGQPIDAWAIVAVRFTLR